MLECDIKASLQAAAKEGEETAEIYRREARSIYEQDPLRAATMLIDAAYANDRDESQVSSIERDLCAATCLAPKAAWIASAARRLFVKIGNWENALELLERELLLATTPDLKIACALEAASITWIVMNDAESARKWTERALLVDADNIGALYNALWLDCSLNRLAESAADAEKIARILGAPEERATLFSLAGDIRLALSDDQSAHELFLYAVRADKNALYALLGLAFLDLKFGRVADSAQNFNLAASKFDQNRCKGEFYALAGSAWYYVGDLVKACAAFEEALRCGNLDVLRLELEACQRLGNASRAIEIENELISESTAPLAIASRYVEMAWIAQEAGDDSKAIEALDHAGACCDVTRPVFEWRVALYEKNHRYAELAELLKARLVHNVEPQLNAYYAWKLARAYVADGRENNAIDAIRTHASKLNRWRNAILLERAGDDESLVRALDAWLSETTDEKVQSALKSRIVTLLVDRLDHPEIALQYVKDLPESNQSFDLLFQRMLLLESLGQHEPLLESFKRIASQCTCADDVQMWMMEEAAILEEKNAEDAMRLLKALHDAWPAFLPAIEMYRGIALKNENWNQLLVANSWRSFSENDCAAENAWCCLKNGLHDEAIKWFNKAQKASGLDAVSLRACVRLLRQAGRCEEAVQLLDLSLNSGGEDKWDFSALNEVIPESGEDDSLNYQNLNKNLAASTDLDEDEICYMKRSIVDMQAWALGGVKNPDTLLVGRPSLGLFIQYAMTTLINAPKADQLKNIMNASAKVDLSDEESKALFLWLCAHLLMRDGNALKERVDDMLKASLSRSYGKGLRAVILRRLRTRRDADVTAWLETYASWTPDKWVATELLREAALRSLWGDRDLDSARRNSLAAFKQGGNDWRSIWELERFADQSEDYQALGVLRERMSQLEPDPKARLQAMKSALAPYCDEELEEHATRVAQECLKQDVHDFTALLTLAQIAEDDDNRVALANIADRLSEASANEENRLGYGLWAGKLWQDLGRNDQAFASLSSLLAHDPKCMPAIAMSEQLLSSMAQYEKLSLVYVRAIGALEEGKTQIELLRKQAQLLAYKLDDAAGASIALARILSQASDDVDALTMQTELLAKQSRWSEAVETLELRIRCTQSAEDKRVANLELGDILIHRVGDMERARRLLKRHLTQFVHDIDALRLMYDIACSERNWLEARVTLDEICQSDSPLLTWARLAYTRIAREAEWTNDMRVIYERAAVQTVIGQRDDFETLVNDYKQHGDLERLIRVAKYDLSRATESDRIAQYRGCVAALYVANEQHREALSFLSEVINEKQTDWAYHARAQALFSAGQLDSSAAEFRRTLTLNLSMEKAYEPFLEVLHQLGDDVAYASAKAVINHRLGQPLAQERCLSGSPRGFFDIELIPIERVFIEAFQYLRLMTPYIYPIYERPQKLHALDSRHWASTRCRQLFGQNFDVKPLYIAKQTGGSVNLSNPPALVISNELVDDNDNAQFDFWAAYAMHQATTGAALIDAIDDDEVDALFMALCQAEPETARAQALKSKITKALPRSDRKLFKDGVPFKAPNWSAFRQALSSRAACVAAIISGSPAVALSAFPNDEVLQKFLISDTYVRLAKLYWNVN